MVPKKSKSAKQNRVSNELLWTKYKASPTQDIKNKITLNYLKLVHYVIHRSGFTDYGILDARDYFQFGFEGLNEAIDRFDPDYGTKFETYAIQRIRGKIIDELRKIQTIPRRIKTDDKQEFINNKMSLTSSYGKDSEYMLQEVIPSASEIPDEIFEKEEQKELLYQAIKQMNERDRLILSLYYYDHLGYKEIAEVLNITVSRISQIHSRIIENLKNILEKKYEYNRNKS